MGCSAFLCYSLHHIEGRAYKQNIDIEGAKTCECKSAICSLINVLYILVHTVDHHSESEEVEHAGPRESLSLPPHSTVSTMEIVEEDTQTNSLVCNVGSYDWLVEHFKSMQ